MTRHPEIQVKSNKLHIILPVTIVSGVVIIILATMFRFEFGLILLGIGGLVITAGGVAIAQRIGKLTVAGLIGVEQIKQERAKTQRMRLEATVVETRHGLIMSGGRFIPPSASERQALRLNEGPVIEGAVTRLDLPYIFTQQQLAYTLIGAQRSGKTYQAMHLVDRWLGQNVTPLVVCYKKRVGEWSGCQQIITDDPGVLARALRGIIATGRERNNSQRQDLPPQPIFLDDWMWTVMNVENAETFFSEAGTGLASANLICYFLMQSDTKDAYGGGKYGAMLKNNLTKLILEPKPDGSGAIIPGRSKGFLQYPNSRERLPIALVPGMPQCIQGAAAAQMFVVREAEPTDEEQKVIEVWQKTGSYRQTTMAVWGQWGDFYNRKIDEILKRYSKIRNEK